MNKTKKIVIIVIIAMLLTAVLYFIILHPRVKTYLSTVAIYEEFGGNRDIGEPIIEYDYSNVTDESLVLTDFGTFRLGIPSDWEDRSKEDSEFTTYCTIGAASAVGKELEPNEEIMVFNPAGNDNSSIVLLNNEELYEESGFSDADIRHLTKGFEKLGYEMPDSAYATLKCAHSLTPEDYNFLKYDESLAFAYALVFRAGSLYYSNGSTAKTYYYETDDKCAIINEQYRPDYDGKYHFKIEVYDADDLNTGYIFTMTVTEKETAYAMINSLTFDE